MVIGPPAAAEGDRRRHNAHDDYDTTGDLMLVVVMAVGVVVVASATITMTGDGGARGGDGGRR